ncbi:MAG: RNA-binding transcriptional accessory protein, partial [Gammaproteobacteria bacterium]|nr:RNA-binding transcriptional accessory protein [Gammaproteobacteria bacterium]
MISISHRISQELNVRPEQIEAATKLLDEGATVPFIARYRKEATGGLDDTQLRDFQERLIYLRELDERRETVLRSIEEQGKLNPELQKQILEADTKTRLEDLYRPYMPKRRTKAQIAREAGLEPLAYALLKDHSLVPESEAEKFLDAEKGVDSVETALEGARQILMEDFAEDAELSQQLRDYVWENAMLQSQVIKGKEEEGNKFSDYFDNAQLLKTIPSHRALAMFRGRTEDVLKLELVFKMPEGEYQALGDHEHGISRVAERFKIDSSNSWLWETARYAWRLKFAIRLSTELKVILRENAEKEAIHVFANNLKDLLLAAPAGARTTLGLDPGYRTGVKVAVIDKTGKLVDTATIYPHAPQNQWDRSLHTLAALCEKHACELIAIGNGTASRETEKLANDLLKMLPKQKLAKIVVSEAGASVYSASQLAANEFPELDVSLRGAVSIARRLQDPLAELVKIDPKSIGVGQYQHDVNQSALSRELDHVVEDCVNAVGVDVNTASPSLLAYVSGLSQSIAKNIVSYRDKHGAFKSRDEIKQVPRLGDKAYEQCAGFLRIPNGSNPLDASAVHPEAYEVVNRICEVSGKSVQSLIGDTAFLKSANASHYVDEKFGEPTVRDILLELDKPGRDPRPEFKSATFKDGIENPSDLKPDMILEGVVTNVTNFGAFVDIGVHQDGLVHISALSEQYVKDPRLVVKTGDVVKVKVIEVDLQRKR